MLDALADVLHLERPRSQTLRAARDWVDEMTRPPPGSFVSTSDGTRLTGIVLVDDNRVLRVLALRQEGRARGQPDHLARTSFHHPDEEPSEWEEEPAWLR